MLDQNVFFLSGRISLTTLCLESRPDKQLLFQHLPASSALYLELLLTDRHSKRPKGYHDPVLNLFTKNKNKNEHFMTEMKQ